jgi:hypothetical protein
VSESLARIYADHNLLEILAITDIIVNIDHMLMTDYIVWSYDRPITPLGVDARDWLFSTPPDRTFGASRRRRSNSWKELKPSPGIVTGTDAPSSTKV